MEERQPLAFFLRGAAALVALFGVTLLMAPRPEVNALRAGILFGVALIGLKIVLRRYNIAFPPRARRHRPVDPPQRPE
jgi:hypothetical protein